MYEVKVTREFAAAHFLRDYVGKCANMHGHNWKVEVSFQKPTLADNGILVDFNDLWKIIDELIEIVDHHNLNEIPPFDQISPTSENLAKWFYDEIEKRLPHDLPPPNKVVVWETSDACASYWKEES